MQHRPDRVIELHVRQCLVEARDRAPVHLLARPVSRCIRTTEDSSQYAAK